MEKKKLGISSYLLDDVARCTINRDVQGKQDLSALFMFGNHGKLEKLPCLELQKLSKGQFIFDRLKTFLHLLLVPCSVDL